MRDLVAVNLYLTEIDLFSQLFVDERMSAMFC